MMARIAQQTDWGICKPVIGELKQEYGEKADWSGLCYSAIKEERLLIVTDTDGSTVLGFVSFYMTHLPDTYQKGVAERMLYVSKEGRGGLAAVRLLEGLELWARYNDCDVILAGSSLGNNRVAQRLYEACGFQTNLTFRKDLRNVRSTHTGYGNS